MHTTYKTVGYLGIQYVLFVASERFSVKTCLNLTVVGRV